PQIVNEISNTRSIVTPHAGEYKRLFGHDPGTTKSEMTSNVRKLAKEYGIIVVLKGSLNVISDGEQTAIIKRSTPAMTVGGSGVIETNIHTVTRSKIVLLGNSRFANAYRKYLDDVPNGLPPSAVARTIVDTIASASPKLQYIIGSRREKACVRLRPYIPNKLFY